MRDSIKYKMNRKRKGSRVFFWPTIDGMRLNGTNYARKYDAENLVMAYLRHYGSEKLLELVAEAKKKKAAEAA